MISIEVFGNESRFSSITEKLIEDTIKLKDECFGQRLFNYIPDNFIVAFDLERNVVGYCGLDFQYIENGVHIESLCVNKHYRRKGIGKSILDKVYEVGKLIKDIEYLALEVNRQNKDLLIFYEKCGFNADIRPGYCEISFKKTIVN
jgi:ribosomal protein S18 acetylase RimI-like enzyme